MGALIAASVLLSHGMETIGTRSLSVLWAMGLGSLRGDSLIQPSLTTSLTGIVLLSNLPQLILSFLYFLYNGLFTSMLLGAEWASFSTKRQALRVSTPVGDQRSSYRLQLPYAYSLPMLIAMTSLHWLVSQSIFFASVVFVKDDKEVHHFELAEDNRILGCGYSCIAIFIAILLAIVMLLVLIGNGFREYNQEIPLVSSCSIAIASCCHPPEEDVDADKKQVKWGIVRGRNVAERSQELTGHGNGYCSLTSFEVGPPLSGPMPLRCESCLHNMGWKLVPRTNY